MDTFIKTGSRRNLRIYSDNSYVRSMNLSTVFLANIQPNILTVILSIQMKTRKGICFKISETIYLFSFYSGIISIWLKEN